MREMERKGDSFRKLNWYLTLRTQDYLIRFMQSGRYTHRRSSYFIVKDK